MPWRDSQTVPLTRIDIVSQVPSESGVYAIADGDIPLLVGEAWNLKARLLEIMSLLEEISDFRVTYELCPEEQRAIRKQEISAAILKSPSEIDIEKKHFSGISFRGSVRP